MPENELIAPELERKLNYSERATWGECPVCKAQHGEKCMPSGIILGRNINGEIPEDGVHFGRISKAPVAIRIVPVF